MKTPVDRSDAADARRLRWMLDGNGYFLEEEGLCAHFPDKDDQDYARRKIDESIPERWSYKGV